jgi:hypothetical protein
MGRFTATIESQAAQSAGTPSGTTFNGYFAAVVAGASANFKLRRVKISTRGPSGSITSQQNTVAIYRQTVRVAGTGFSTTTGQNLDARGVASSITGADVTTAASAGTTGPTIGANAMEKLTFNTQTSWDVPWDYIEDFICDQGTANGLAFVNIGNALPANTLFVVTATWEE